MKAKFFIILTLMLCPGAFSTLPAHAAETLTVTAAQMEGDNLRIDITDKEKGEGQSLLLNLREFASGSDEFVTIQAVDHSGNRSNSVSFRNPYYEASAAAATSVPPESESALPAASDRPALPDGAFIPEGAGTVTGNATDGDGKEFFTIEAEEGQVFYLIVDRRRGSENVYFLNAVTENDLLPLAQQSEGTAAAQTPPEPPEPEPAPAPPAQSGGEKGAVIFIALTALAIGGAGYYFKILRPKRQAAEPSDEAEDYDEDYGEYYGGEDGEGK